MVRAFRLRLATPAMATTPVSIAVIATTTGAAAEGNEALPTAAGFATVVSADSATEAAVTPTAASGAPSRETASEGNTLKLPATTNAFAHTGRSIAASPLEIVLKRKLAAPLFRPRPSAMRRSKR